MYVYLLQEYHIHSGMSVYKYNIGNTEYTGYTYNKTCPSVCDILIMNNMKQEYLCYTYNNTV